MDRFSDLRAAVHRNSIKFLKTDLDVALTFASIAEQAGTNLQKKQRNQTNARHAYDQILELLERTVLNQADSKDIGDGLARLKLALKRLGEVF